MKKFIVFSLIMLALFAFVPTHAVLAQCDASDPSCAPAPDGLTLPSEFQLLLAGAIGYLVTNGLKGLGVQVTGVAAQITAGLVTASVAFINSLLALVPAAAQPSAAVGFSLVLTILSAYGIHYSRKAAGKK